MLQTMMKQLEALEGGSLKETDREAALEDNGDLLQTVRRKACEVPPKRSSLPLSQ